MTKPIFATILLFCFMLSVHAQLKKGETPNWVAFQDYSKTPDIDSDDISYGLLQLLRDEQLHAQRQERYIRSVIHILEQVGVQDASSISINYDPTYQTLILHDITVIRNEERIDKLNLNDFQTLRKESNAENYIYDGSLDAMVNLADIRKGDIIDFSYTIKGFNPMHGGSFSGGFSMDEYQPLGRIHARILSQTPLNYKLVNSKLATHESQVNGMYEYAWEATNVPAVNFEFNTPASDFVYQNIFFSSYNNWAEVAKWAMPIYKPVKPDTKLQNKINSIKATYEEDYDRVSSALKFVQNEVRYLGLEDGIGSYKPFSPNKVFSQRFGDCKDKSYLLITMLKGMGINAYPVLINSTYGKALDKFLPSPRIFDHVTVKVVFDDEIEVFYDPTISNQGGLADNVYFPDYGYGLVIQEDTVALENIENTSTNMVEVYDTFAVDNIGGGGTLNIYTVYHQQEADAMRASLQSNSLTSVSEEFLSFYNGLYDDVEVLEKPTFEDDTLSNKITIYESYKIGKLWTPMENSENNITMVFTPYNISNIMMVPESEDRKTSYDLVYPSTRQHNITVKLPERWSIRTEESSINSKSFYYTLEIKTNPAKNILYLNHYYKNQNTSVAPEDFSEYYSNIMQLQNNLSYLVYIDKRKADVTVGDSSSNTSLGTTKSKSWIPMVLALLIIGAVIGIYVVRAKRA
ncbi:DUF3857 domain-containing transglutaminase family protein [Winogradskyella maritima]|uniref:DUF3857 domain-containing transglutaminase family protein n=1 Tax=Winogradskyella maritima TaxID=1517766 RepID=A0ABV8AIY2_9FLAO|nr:DUF3857 domain-containing transglutaminase family protein [Winogradskyella maritima]